MNEKEIRQGFIENRKAGYNHGYSDGYNKAIEEFAEKCNQKITEFILEHQNQITFVSGVSMGWKIIDEIAESMKGGTKDGKD